MQLLDTMRRQTCVYWPAIGADRHGDPVFAYPRELRVRWVKSTQIVTDARGQQRTSNSQVYPGEDMIEWSAVKLDVKLADIPEDRRLKPFLNTDVFQIMKFDKIPTLDARDFARIAYL